MAQKFTTCFRGASLDQSVIVEIFNFSSFPHYSTFKKMYTLLLIIKTYIPRLHSPFYYTRESLVSFSSEYRLFDLPCDSVEYWLGAWAREIACPDSRVC